MAIVPAVLQPGTTLTTAVLTVYTTPTGTKAIVKRATLTNWDTVTRVVSVYRVPAGGSASNNNIILSNVALITNQDYSPVALSGLTLGPGETIRAICDAASAVNIFMSGFTST